jgi:hypothetical protein
MWHKIDISKAVTGTYIRRFSIRKQTSPEIDSY